MKGRFQKPRVTIVGGGVIGLTCASVLARDYNVTIVARELGSQTNSRLATAVWHIYLIKGPTELPTGDHHLAWGEQTLRKLLRIAATTPAACVEMIDGVELYRIDEPTSFPAWMNIAEKLMGLRFLSRDDLSRLNSPDVSVLSFEHAAMLERHPIKWGYTLRAPATCMRNYLSWLVNTVCAAGCCVREQTIQSFAEIADKADVIVNCTGLGAQELTGDHSFTPYRGQYFVLQADETTPRGYVGDDYHPLGMAYAIPRAGEVMVGGTAEANTLDLTPSITWAEIRERASLYFSWIREAAERQNVGDPVVCLRPVRTDGVRLDADYKSADVPVIHNYGHGGSGFSLSWGCAYAVASKLKKIFNECAHRRNSF